MTDLLPKQIEVAARAAAEVIAKRHGHDPEDWYNEQRVEEVTAAIEAYEATRTPPDDGIEVTAELDTALRSALRDSATEVAALQASDNRLVNAARDVVDKYDWWSVDEYGREGIDDEISELRAALKDIDE